MRAVRRARQVLTRDVTQFTLCSNRAATLLAFGARAAVVRAAAFATFTAETSTTATTATPALAAEIALATAAFATWFAAEFAATTGLATFAAGLALLVARSAILTAITAAAAVATLATLTIAAIATGVALWCTTGSGAARGRRGFGRSAAEDAFQPAHESAGFFLRFGRARGAFLVRLILARLELAIVTTRLARLEAARTTAVTRFAPTFAWLAPAVAAALARIAWVTRLEGTALTAFAAGVASLAPIARLKRRAVVAAWRGLCRGSSFRAAGGFPMQRGALGVFRREDVELGLGAGFRCGAE